MRTSAKTFGTVQTARAATLPQRAAAAPARVTALEAVRQRNTILDALFYDVKTIGEEEAVGIAPWLAAEGAILIVPPSGGGSLILCASIDEFVDRGGVHVSAIAVAGVGSSALGSAAFARNVADAIGRTVAAVVSGYGLADVATEAMGGAFLFGGLNSLRHSFEWLDRLTESGVIAEPLPDPGEGSLARASRDTRTVLALLDDDRLSFDLLIGHSKGNLVISEALFNLKDSAPAKAKALASSAHIVTVSAIIAMPSPFKVIDVIGAWDWFGCLNSRADIPPDFIVQHAWHHTNTELFAHLPVTKILRKALPQHFVS